MSFINLSPMKHIHQSRLFMRILKLFSKDILIGERPLLFTPSLPLQPQCDQLCLKLIFCFRNFCRRINAFWMRRWHGSWHIFHTLYIRPWSDQIIPFLGHNDRDFKMCGQRFISGDNGPAIWLHPHTPIAQRDHRLDREYHPCLQFYFR